MLGGDYGQNIGGNDFAAQPRLIMGKPKFKDPYGKNIEEYFPQNIMHDRRIMRGSTYAAMVIPAGTNPDTMVMEKNYPRKTRTLRAKEQGRKARNIYPNRDIPSPEPVPGRSHMDIQTDPYKEILTDKPAEREQGIATEFYLDRPPVPLFQPRMPSKANCKSTQIYEGDHELFDFNAEVEPMLNVLCSKTLEQARMEVLEETELAIMKSQQKEYEEVVNAELVEAQRFEAAEQRCKEEVERRAVQNKARKQDRRAAHQKINARMISKGYLAGLREQSLVELARSGILNSPQTNCMEEQVIPWLLDKIQDFLREDQATLVGSDGIVCDGINGVSSEHKATIQAKYAKDKKDEDDREEAKRQNELRKEKRKEERKKRALDEELDRFRDTVERNIIFKGEVSEVLRTNLLDIHGNYQQTPFVGTLGGQLMQMCYVLEEIQNRYPAGLKDYMQKKIEGTDEEYFSRPNNLRELTVPEHLMPFLMRYIKDMKNECIELLLHPIPAQYLESVNIDVEDISKLDDDQLIKFKEHFMTYRKTSLKNAGKTMDNLLDNLIDIAAKRVPTDNSNVKADQIRDKVRFIPHPEGIVEEDYTEEVTTTNEDGTENVESKSIPANIDFKALMYLKIPQREQEEEVPVEEEEEGRDPDAEVPTTTVIRKVDEDQGGKALAIQCRNPANMQGDQLYQVNQYAGNMYRENFIEFIHNTYPEFFDDNEDQDLITQAVHTTATQEIEKWIATNTGEYVKPSLEFTPAISDI